MNIQTDIETKIAASFAPLYLDVVNESHMHSVPENSETHFKVTLVSDVFNGKRKVQRHQAVYAAIADELAGPVHALALHLYTADEWDERQGLSPDSPNCLGGSKREAKS